MDSKKERSEKLTVIVLCYNVEKSIEACLKSVVWADEILVVDSFSTDRTLEIARRYTDRILQHEYINYATQMNWTIPQATYDWVLILDSDERLSPELADEIQDLLMRGFDKDGYLIRRENNLFGERVRFSGWGNEKVSRLFRREIGRYQEKRVHAKVELKDSGVLKNPLIHDSVDSIEGWLSKINRYSTWKAQDKYEKRVPMPILQMIFRPPFRFFKDFVFRLGILDGWRGFLIASMSAYAELSMTAKLVKLNISGRNDQR